MRPISADMINEYSSPQVRPILMAEFLFDSATVGMFTGYGTLNWAGKEFLGGGEFINVSTIEETQDLVAKGAVFNLNGVDTSLISLALSENIKNRHVRLYLAASSVTSRVATEDEPGAVLVEDGDGYVVLENTLVDSPYRLFSGLMDIIEINESGSTCDITLSAENILYRGQRSKILRYTQEEQKQRFPLDKGLDFIDRLQDREIVW